MTETIHFETEGSIAVIVIDNPPVNTGSWSVRKGLLDAVEKFAQDETLTAAVIIGKDKNFISGSDLKEFGKPITPPELPQVIKAIEECPKPVIAAISGATLGGGYELALGCDARLAAANTLVGLPEVTLGMLPGAGGTQRLPRLIGLGPSIEVICSGKRLKAAEAFKLGMVEAIAEGDLRPFAIEYAKTAVKNPLSKKMVAAELAEELDGIIKKALKAGKNRPQVKEAIRLIQATATVDFETALAEEREVFQKLRVGEEAFALRHLFFAETSAKKAINLKETPVKAINNVVIVGAGTMGTGIAVAALRAGFKVAVYDQSKSVLVQCKSKIDDIYEKDVAAGRIKPSDQLIQLEQLELSDHDSVFENADLIIEAIFENLTVKQNLIKQIESVASPNTLIASNTSYIDLDEIAEVSIRPENIVGIHFFNPANIMRLVEVIHGNNTSQEVIASAFAFVQKLGKLPILCKNSFGFIGNRIYAAYRYQCELMLEEGALPHEIDQAIEGFGFNMGPFAVGDLSGLDIAWNMRKANASKRDPKARYVDIPDQLCEAQRFGRKTGAGYYSYANGKPEIDPIVTDIILKASATKGIERKNFTPEQIVERVLLTMANEAALLLAEGVTLRMNDIDLVMINGFGFPKWEGGPAYWASKQDLNYLYKQQEILEHNTGIGFNKGDLSIFHKLAKTA
ncbi:3-hydroxyacyl-CoA dehydrogenase (plasmid) [Acinetobacter sp. LoGeW2-3]|uniref:3-hydroxyacyl-CoA dehydrogenase NAD-binding domain-containing protein n=1 Tax=Acinetobacter sp. LoGeW2-3 TaxID=1808001 RepID=UPI000C05BB79|nr:3-hydroxyacyl-CoA dehydrogenase NAD-binding domain-containing protein [Acinetobacter sp. LoGeW2-3]ATO21103.1 3-hydroxyacyl-CoA dehydrogenase [Acinetobacter sp. LoGeW2-3]ATO21215.1 3-hydroxyacyl-CoA dehydrogenase [Acinetobacter sp. LoGeW2-3]